MSSAVPFCPSYHGLCRPEIASLIPLSAAHILDLGCGSGTLGAHIKKRQPCTYHGIEINKAAAEIAKTKLDCCYDCDCQQIDYHLLNYDYDIIILADILEHLSDPLSLLKKIAPILKKDGTMIASIPNIAHPSIRTDLSRGLFRYQAAGILDRTHLRHFTMISIFQMFSSLNLKITSCTPFPSADNPIQYLITAAKSPYYGKILNSTIIIPSSSNGPFLQRTINSIMADGDTNARIIVINNALNPKTTSWIEQHPHILEIRCPVNLGFTIGTNLGMEISETEYIILCNDDIIVPKHWLCHLIASAKSDPSIGIVGPISNRVSGPQIDNSAHYQTEKELFDYSLKVTQADTGHLEQFHRIVFFCTLIKKEVIDKIGYLDEIFSPGNFEDDDYCLRAIEAGFKCMIDRSVFVHHYGSQSWQKDQPKFKKLMERNQAIFLSRWGSKLGSLLKHSS